MKIIAIDPGYERLGIAVIEKNSGQRERVLYSNCFRTNPKLSHAERLKLIGNEISNISEQFEPKVMAIESLYFSSNKKTAILVAEAKGVILYEASRHGLKIYEYGPGQVKLAITGYGRSDKLSINSMVEKLVKIDKKIKFDDEYDAIAVGLTCFASEKF